MKSDDVEILRSKLDSVYGNRERIQCLFGVQLSFYDQSQLRGDFRDHVFENTQGAILRITSDTSQESIEQAKNYIASLTADDRETYKTQLTPGAYRMILQHKDSIEKTSQAIINLSNINGEDYEILVHGQTKNVASAKIAVEKMVQKTNSDDVRTRGGVDYIRQAGDVTSGTSNDHETNEPNIADKLLQTVSCRLSGLCIPETSDDQNLQTDCGPAPDTMNFRDALTNSPDVTVDSDSIVLLDNETDSSMQLKCENPFSLNTRTSDIDEEIVKITSASLSSPPEPADDDHVDLDPHYGTKVEFALKLGYSENQLRNAIDKLGICAGQNEILSELIKLGKCDKPKEDLERTTSDESDKSVEYFSSIPTSPYDGTSGDEPSSEPSVILPSQMTPENFRHIVIDGSNVAMSHGNKEIFSCRGIKLAVDWFRQRGHSEITVFVPQWRKETSRPDAKIKDQDVLNQLEKEKVLVFTPARRIGGKRVVCYDDRYVLNLAADTGGIVVSNDNYRDLLNESPQYRKVVEERLLMYSFVNDRFMPPDDPLGRNGPKLDNFLCKEPTVPEPLPPLCPYGSKKCTYGNKCKFYHPERGNLPHKSVSEKLAEQAKQKMLEVKERGLKTPESDKRKQLTRKPKAKVSLHRTQSLVPASMLENSPDDTTTSNRHSADISDFILSDIKQEEILSEQEEKTKKYNDKLTEFRKKMEKAEQEENKRQEEETKRTTSKDSESSGTKSFNNILSTANDNRSSRSPSPHQRTCSPSQLKPQEQFLSGHLLLAKKLSDEAAEVKKSRHKNIDERDSTKTPPADGPHQPSNAQYRCNSPLAQTSAASHQLASHSQSASPQSQPTRRHQGLSRQYSLQGNQDPRLQRTVHQQLSYDPRLVQQSPYNQNSQTFERHSDRHAGLHRQNPLFYGEQDNFFKSQMAESNVSQNQNNRQPLSRQSGNQLNVMEHPSLSRMQSAPETPQLRKAAVAPSKIGLMVRQNSSSDTQLHTIGGDGDNQSYGEYHYDEFQQGDLACRSSGYEAQNYQYQSQNFGRSVSVTGNPQYPNVQPQKSRTGNTTWSIGSDKGVERTYLKLHGNVASGHPQFMPFQYQRAQRFHEIDSSLLRNREEDIWYARRASSPSVFGSQRYQVVDSRFDSRGSGGQNQAYSVMQGYGPNNTAIMTQNQPFMSTNQPQMPGGQNQTYQPTNPPVQTSDMTSVSSYMSSSDVVPQASHADDLPIHASDPRYNVYYHLCGLFPETKVRSVMNSHPDVSDPQELCAYIIGAKQ